MQLPFYRPGLAALIATSLAVALTLALTVGAQAQVASLAGPDETPAPEEVAAAVAYEDRDEAMLAYAQCMRDNGIEVDDPVIGSDGRGRIFGGGPGTDGPAFDFGSEDFLSASEACAPILEAARPEIDPEAEQERLEQQLQLAQCIRDNGYPEYPDPAIGTGGRLERAGFGEMDDIGIDFRSEEFRQILDSCRDELGFEQPGFGPGRGLGGS